MKRYVSLAQHLRALTTEHPDRLAYKFLVDGKPEGPEWTRADLERRARVIGAMLQDRHARGERAILLYPQGLEFLAVLLGCMQSGVIAVPTPAPEAKRLQRALPRLQAVVRDCGATIVMTTSEVLGLMESCIAEIPDLARMTWLATEQVPLGLADEWKEESPDPDDIAYLQYTSGSTSSPNGVMISHGSLMHHFAYLKRANGYTSDSVTVNWMPHFHDYGLVEGLLQPLYNGTPCYFMAPLSFIKRPFYWLGAITQFKGTHTQAPNFAFDHCVKRILAREREHLDLRSCEAVGNAAEPINPKVMFEFMRTFEPYGFRPEAMCPAYGLAEATLLVSSSPKHVAPSVHRLDATALEKRQVVDASGDVPVRHVAGCGPLVCDVRVEVVNPDTKARCGPDEIGEIWVSDPSVAKGYWRKPEKSEEAFGARLAESDAGPFLRTGDLGFMRDGEVCIVGRIKDLIIIRGANFYPQDIEWTVQRCHPALELGYGAAFPVIANGDERLVIFQELKRGLDPDQDLKEVIFAIRQAVAEEYDIRTLSVHLVPPGGIPKTSSGKIKRHGCRQMFLDGSVDAIESWQEGSPPVHSRSE